MPTNTPAPAHIAIADYDYDLPNDRIAKYPLEQRDQSRLLLYRGGQLEEHRFAQLPSLLPADALLVFNNTKVIHARLHFRKAGGATIEVFCLEPWRSPVAQAFEQRGHCTWLCLIGNNKKWKSGPLSLEVDMGEATTTLQATRREAVGDSWVVDFDWTGNFDFASVIERAGVIPLPPYLHRQAEQSDADRYQTVYAQHYGSVAAPTAGLHFTPELLDQLGQTGIPTAYVTLHVGAGTFKPVSSTTIGQHTMHAEPVSISLDELRHITSMRASRRLIAVGTTSVRTLESIYWFGVQLKNDPSLQAMSIGQWDPYTLSSSLSPIDALQEVIAWMERRGDTLLHGVTRLLIAPGYTYRVVQGLITNFHQPKSTLLLLVSALIGDDWRRCYRYALDNGFRFLSYGDSCLFLP